jgi:hypothetical protein
LATALNFLVIRHLRVWLAESLAILAILWWVCERIGRRGANRILVLLVWVILPVVVAVLTVSPLRGSIVGSILYLGEPIGLAERLDTQRFAGLEEASSDSLGGRMLRVPLFIRVPVLLVQLLVQIPPWASIDKYGLIPRAIGEFIAASAWVGFLIFLPAGFLDTIRSEVRRRTVWIWGTAISLGVSLAVASTIIPRWRLMIMPFLLILVARGITTSRHRWTVKWSAAMIIALMVIYISMKYGGPLIVG